MKKRVSCLSAFCMLFILAGSPALLAQSKVVTGKVTLGQIVPAEGASVLLTGTSIGTTTGADGSFTLTVPSLTGTLTVSYQGYTMERIALKNRTHIEVALQLAGGSLDSVVVVGYGTQKRDELTAAISSVKGDAIKNLPVQSVADALQGRIAGVEVMKASGEPGASAQIVIRGVSSLNQTQPLYIIDGVQQSGYSIDGTRQYGISINPQDIASIDVLKDAGASAIYGAAAAGGVIIITTKKGQGTKLSINLNSRYGVTTPRVLKLLNKTNFIALKHLVFDQYYTNMTEEGIDTLPDVNWVDELYRNGTEENYNLSVSGSTPAINFFASGVYNKQKGVFLDNQSVLAGARINADFKIARWLKLGEQLNVWQRRTNPVKTSIVSAPFRTAPTGAPYTNKPDAPWGGFPNYQAPNLIAQIKTTKFDFPENNFQGNVYAEVKLPPKYLTFKATFGYTSQTYENNIFNDVYNTAVTPVTINRLYRRIGKFEQILNAYVLSFDHTYGLHTVNALAGYEQYTNKSSYLQTTATGVSGSSFGYILTSGSEMNIAGGYDPNGLVKSTFARVGYDFDKRYFVTASVRRDGNFTVFGPDHQYGVFPAASVGWRIDQEPFIRNNMSGVNLLKFRASYGELGNSNINPYQFLTTFKLINYQNFSNGGPTEAGYTQESLVNNGIKWESVHETNIGMDGELMNGALSFTVDWYNKTTRDLLYGVPVPPSVGLPGSPPIYTVNVGSVRNRGLEIAVGYKNNINAFNYAVNVNGAFNKNKVLNLNNLSDAAIQEGNNNYPDAGNGKWTGQALTYTTSGLPFGQFYGYKVLGIYKTDEEAAAGAQQPGAVSRAGDLIFWDKTKDGDITDLDKTVIGNPYPEFIYGATVNLSWKGFDMALLFNGVAGVDIFNGVAPYEMSVYDGGNVTSRIFDASFLGSNGLTDQPRIGVLEPSGTYTMDPNHNYSYASSYFVENGSYLKLKNLQIGYNFSCPLFRRAGVSGARLYVMGNNIFTITSYKGADPELGSLDMSVNSGTTTRGLDGLNKYPVVKIYSIGLDLSF